MPDLVPMLGFTLLAIASGVLLGWVLRGTRIPDPLHVPDAPDGEDAGRHRRAYVEAVTGPHPIPQSPFGVPAHTMPGVRALRPNRKRGPRLADDLRPPVLVEDVQDTSRISIIPGPRAVPSSPELLADATETMPRVKR